MLAKHVLICALILTLALSACYSTTPPTQPTNWPVTDTSPSPEQAPHEHPHEPDVVPPEQPPAAEGAKPDEPQEGIPVEPEVPIDQPEDDFIEQEPFVYTGVQHESVLHVISAGIGSHQPIATASEIEQFLFSRKSVALTSFMERESHGRSTLRGVVLPTRQFPLSICDDYYVQSILEAYDDEIDYRKVDNLLLLAPAAGHGTCPSTITNLGESYPIARDINGKEYTFALSMIVVPGVTTYFGEDQDNKIITHEYLHTKSLSHSNSIACDSFGALEINKTGCYHVQYGDKHSVMGSGSSASGLNAVEKYQLGWLDDNTKIVSDGAYTLYSSDTYRPAGDAQLLLLPVNELATFKWTPPVPIGEQPVTESFDVEIKYIAVAFRDYMLTLDADYNFQMKPNTQGIHVYTVSEETFPDGTRILVPKLVDVGSVKVQGTGLRWELMAGERLRDGLAGYEIEVESFDGNTATVSIR